MQPDTDGLSADRLGGYKQKLASLLRTWIGDDFRVVELHRIDIVGSHIETIEYFRSIPVFGSDAGTTQAGLDLDSRHGDFAGMNELLKFENRREFQRALALPWPFDMGESWDEQAVQIPKDSANLFPSFAAWRYFFGDSGLRVLKRHGAEILGAVAEHWEGEIGERIEFDLFGASEVLGSSGFENDQECGTGLTGW